VALSVVEALRESGAVPERLVAAIGPSIGPCCYEVGDELIAAFEQSNHARRDIMRWFLRAPHGSLRLNLARANRDQLMAAGVPSARVFALEACTACQLDRFCSFRAEGPSAGRMAAAISPSRT
jgi:copper oxidase (laccase) domain-containing protein